MKRIVLFITTIFLAALFTSGTALGMSHESNEKTGVPGEPQHPGMTETERTESGISEQQEFAAQQLDEEQVRELKMILQDEGYEVGELDGEIGQETRDAIREFQRSEDLAVTGEPDEETLRALAPSAEQQEFFGLSPEFGEENKEMLQDRESPQEREMLEEPGREGDIQETPRTID